eukprot:comp12883_c0_seq1/m.8072 comp12883_c0_seq1/g.8072  ORF comp12883_c0_seq1/g.8072 comp12883_c0_seq1/m.8072 type:complete len:197 (-) comp12883_c0_seq1:650-1240(-)
MAAPAATAQAGGLIHKKMVVVGDGACGKTCLLIRIAQQKFLTDKYVPTVFENYATTQTVDGKQIELALWDTAGQEDYDHIRPLSYPNANVVLMCYSVDNIESLENVKDKWVIEVKHHAPGVPYILCGLKKDLRGNPATAAKEVSPEKGQEVADEIGAAAYVECSAKTDENVGVVLEKAIRTALAFKPKKGGKCTVL